RPVRRRARRSRRELLEFARASRDKRVQEWRASESRFRDAGLTRRQGPNIFTRSMTTAHRDFLQIPDFSAAELEKLFALADAMRSKRHETKPLAGKTLAMIFMKSSTRTRVSCEVGTYQ